MRGGGMSVEPTSEPEVYFRDAQMIKTHQKRVWSSGILGLIGLGLFGAVMLAWNFSNPSADWQYRLRYLFGIGVAICGVSALYLPISTLSFMRLKSIRRGKDVAGFALSAVLGLACVGMYVVIALSMK